MTIGLSFPFHGLLVLQLGLHKQMICNKDAYYDALISMKTYLTVQKIQNKTKLLDGHINFRF